MTNIIYADNASTTPLDPEAYNAMQPFLHEEFGNAANSYSFSRNPKKAIEEARQIIASCINSSAEEVFFTSGGSESVNWAIKGSALKNRERGKHIVTSAFEHHAVLHSFSFLQEIGYQTTYLPVEPTGHISLLKLEQSLRKDTTLVSIMLANNEIGTIQDIAGIANRLKKKRIILHTDAVQAVGHIPVDVSQLDIDLLSASAHKFNGPKGVGFLYIRKGTDIYNLISGGKQEKGKRAGTENVPGIVGMAIALRNNCTDISENIINLNKLTKIFLETIATKQVDFILNGDHLRLPGNINISIKDFEGETLMHRLDLKGIIISTGSACTSGRTTISHVIKAIRTPKEYAFGTIRITLSKENSIEDVIHIANEISEIVSPHRD